MLPFAQHGPLKWSFFPRYFLLFKNQPKMKRRIDKFVDYYDQQITFHAIFQCHEVLDNHFFPQMLIFVDISVIHRGKPGSSGAKPQTHCLKRSLPKMFQRGSPAPKRSISIKTTVSFFFFSSNTNFVRVASESRIFCQRDHNSPKPRRRPSSAASSSFRLSANSTYLAFIFRALFPRKVLEVWTSHSSISPLRNVDEPFLAILRLFRQNKNTEVRPESNESKRQRPAFVAPHKCSPLGWSHCCDVTSHSSQSRTHFHLVQTWR